MIISKKKTKFTFMKRIQTKTTKIISKAFKSTTKAILNLKLHLLSIQNQINIALCDVILKIITSSIYSHIKIQRNLFDRQFFFEQIQYQKSLYAQLNFLHKFKIRYFVVFKKNLKRLKIKILFSIVSWVKFFQIIMIDSKKTIIITHNAIRVQDTSLIIYIDDSEINDEIKASTMTMFIFIES